MFNNCNPLFAAPPPWYAFQPTTYVTPRILASDPYDSPGLEAHRAEWWLRDQIKKVDRERIKYPTRADLRLKVMGLRRSLKDLQAKGA